MNTLPTTVPRKHDDVQKVRMQRKFDIEDRCPFWDKVGACRHGSKCAKFHSKPKRSKTVVFWKLFKNPIRTYFSKSSKIQEKDDSTIREFGGVFKQNDVVIDEKELDKEANRLYKDLFVELALKYGEVDNILICGNFNPHVGGNVLVKFKDERTAAKCCIECNDRWYNDKPIFCELSPVNYFEDAICKEFDTHKECERGDMCNLIHKRDIDFESKRTLIASQKAYIKEKELL